MADKIICALLGFVVGFNLACLVAVLVFTRGGKADKGNGGKKKGVNYEKIL